jgi:peroxiredoxin
MLVAAALAVSALAAFAQGDASGEYMTLTREVESLTQRARFESTTQGRIDVLETIRAKLTAFREKYPDSPEAADAGFQLGLIAHSVASLKQDPSLYGESVEHLARYALSPDNPRDKVAYAHYYLAEAYKGMGKYEDAEKEYQVVLNEFNDVNPKLTQFARVNLKDLDTQRRLAVGSEPIDFEVKSTTGETLSPDKYKGKVLLLDFWATWCAPCKAEMPMVKKVYQKYNNKGFEIVGISLDRSRKALDNYIAQNNIEWPQYFDGKYFNNDVATQYGIRAIPATYLIDRKGKIRYKSLRGKHLEQAVERLLSEEG